jgi:AcrR family transcriptional regulator
MLDPRILRTRRLLQGTLETMLQKRHFAEISLEAILEAAHVDRTAFFENYENINALLECTVAGKMGGLLEKHRVRFDGSSAEALKGVALCVCDCLDELPGRHSLTADPHLESALIEVVRWIVLEGIAVHLALNGTPANMVASTAAWAIYGAAREWRSSAGPRSPRKAAEIIARIVAPVIESARIDLPKTTNHVPGSPEPEPERNVHPRVRSWAS